MKFTGLEPKKDKSLLRGVYPRKNKTKVPSKTMESLMGLFEQQLVRLNLKRNLGPVDRALYSFFSLFPYKEDPEDFSRIDVEYYKRDREASGYPPASTERNIEHLCAFFHYLIDFHGYNLANPASRLPDSYWKKRLQESLSPPHSVDNIQEDNQSQDHDSHRKQCKL